MRAAVVFVALASLQGPPSLDTTLSRLHAYLLDYEPKLSKLMADESMRQTHARPARARPGEPTWRELKSEMAFVRLPGEGPWLGYRSVTTVNGKPVAERPDRLQALLARGGDEGRRAQEMALESARFNLGLARTTNVPTLPLELLHPRHRERLTFALQGTQRIEGRRLRRLSFEEVSRPTLIRNPDGSDIISYGSVWLEETSGRVFEVEVRSVAGRQPIGTLPEAVLRVSYAEDAALGLLVPTRMRETFALGTGTGTGHASYSNFRRFETSARIIPQR
ncbi:MAG: hypothetical protein ACRD1H_19245 [Vicinamibacterales bacterium]